MFQLIIFLLFQRSFGIYNSRAIPSFKQLNHVLSRSDLDAARSRFNKYDTNHDEYLSREEIKSKFEYLKEKQLDAYWSFCDGRENSDGVSPGSSKDDNNDGNNTRAVYDDELSFQEWLPCAGIYSDNGEIYEEPEYTQYLDAELLFRDNYGNFQLTDKALSLNELIEAELIDIEV